MNVQRDQRARPSTVLWLVFAVTSLTVISAATTTDAPTTTKTPKTTTTITPPTTTAAPPPTTTTTEKTTTTTAPPIPTLGANCTETDWCSGIYGAVCSEGVCSCVFPVSFKYNDTTCLQADTLEPSNLTINGVSVNSSSLTISWRLNDGVTSLRLVYNVQAQNVDDATNTVTCIVPSETTSATKSADCQGLTSGAKYAVKVEVNYTADGEDFSQNALKQVSLFPAQPGGLSTTEFTSPNVTLSWQPSEGRVELYRIKVREISFNKNTTDATSAYTVTGLSAGTNYHVEIDAFSYDKWSAPREKQFRTITKVPDPPTDLTVTDRGTESIELSWIAPTFPNGDIVGYQLCYQYKVYEDMDYSTDLTCNNLSNSTSHNASGLSSGTFYQFSVYTTNDRYNSTETANATNRTEESVPGKVADLKAKNVNTTVSLTWKRPEMPNGHIVAYKVAWYKKSTGDSNSTSFCLTTNNIGNLVDLQCSSNSTDNNTTVDQKELSYLITGVAAYTQYTIKVIAFTKIGAGTTHSIDVHTSITAPSAVTDVYATVLNTTAVEVSWTIPGTYPGPVNYTVSTHDRVFGNISDQICEVSNYNSTSCIVSGLEEYWKYNFSVVAKTEGGESSEEFSNDTQTNPGIPGKISSPRVTKYNTTDACDATKVTVHWTEPDLLERNNLITSYTFENTPVDIVKIFKVNSPEPYALRNRNFNTNISVEAESDYTWKLFAVGENKDAGMVTPIHVTIDSCPPPAWTPSDLNQITYTGRSTTSSVTIILKDSLFNNEQQGKITKKGLIVIPEKSNFYQGYVSMKLGELVNWKSSSLSGFQKEYKIEFSSITAGRRRLLAQTSGTGVRSDDTFTIGEDKSCKSEDLKFCNGPLPDSWTFKLAIYSCTKPSLCRISSYKGPFVTAVPPPPEESSKAWIIAVALLIVILALVGSFIFLWWRGIIDPKKWIGKKDPIRDEHTNFLNLEKKIHQPRPMKIADYFSILEEMHRDTNLQFSDQYDDITKLGDLFKEQSTTHAAKLESNTAKNRWVNILPYDHSRVKLQQVDDDDPTSDYINANYMPGFNTQREYIATQGPLPGTVDDFWRLVWEQNVRVIVMLTQCKEGNRLLGEENLQVKCEKYWPDELREPKQYGDVVVNPVSISQLDKYNISIFYVSVNNTSRQVIHFHYLDFPDFSANVEFDHFIEFVRTVRNHVPHDMSGPIIVHCSAGVGRTGTFIAVDRLQLYLNSPQFSEDDSIDIFDMVVGMRRNRVYMVQTESQYIMIHDCFEKMLGDKKAALQVSDSMENLYANQAFDASPEVLYENVETNTQQRTEL